RDLRAMLWVLQGGPDVPVVPHVAALTGSLDEIAPPEPQEAVLAPAAATPPEEEPEAQTAQEMSDEDLDAAIEAAMARRSAGSADSAEPAEDDPDGEDPAAEAADDAQETDEDAPEPHEAEVPPASAPEGDSPPVEEPHGPRSLETDALVQDLADRLFRLGLVVERALGPSGDRIELALGPPDMPGRMLPAAGTDGGASVDTDGSHYVDTPSQRERDRLRAERLEAAGWATERVWSWALFIDPDGEAERIRRALDRALRLVRSEESSDSPAGVGTIRHRLPR